MSLQNRKLTNWTQPVSSLDDKPQMTAEALKAAFDSNANEIKPALNGVIDDLTGTGGAGEIGIQTIEGLTGTTVQAALEALQALVGLCDTAGQVDAKLALKANKTTTDKLVKTIALNADTGVFTITTDDGTQTTIDTMLAKIPVSCYLDGQQFVLVLDDGTEQRADLSAFLTPNEFTDSASIDFSVSGSTVTASVKSGGITFSMLENTVQTTLQNYVTHAQGAASNAASSEAGAETYKTQAGQSASDAADSASQASAYAVQAAGYAEAAAGSATQASQSAGQAASSVTQASGYAAQARQAAEDAEAVAGGDFIPSSQKGAAGGVASLDSTGKVPSAQLPETAGGDFIPSSQKGTANGVASLDENGQVPGVQIPSLAYIPTAQKAAANGVASLDSTGKVPNTQLPSMDYIPASQKGAASGVAELDATGKVPSAQLPSMDYLPSSQKGTAGGVASLDSTGKVPNTQLPDMNFLPLSGGTMSGNLNMDSRKITGLAAPSADSDAVNKAYVDSLFSGLDDALDALSGEVV